MDRDTAWALVTEHVQDRGLRRHMQAVEAAMRSYAQQMGGDEAEWAATGLLHDFDWEVHPSLEDHPRKGAEILQQRGVPESIIRAILSHNTAATGVERSRPIDFALLACDEVTGLITATALVRPSKDIRDVRVKSIKKKWKDRAFAAGVDRDHVTSAVEDFSTHCYASQLELWTHIGNVLAAMQTAADELDLDGRLAL